MLLTSDLRPSLPLHLIPLAVSTEYSPSLLRIFPTFPRLDRYSIKVEGVGISGRRV